MTQTVRPLWQLLRLATQPDVPITLDCADCFAILEYLADTIAPETLPAPDLIATVRRHTQHCPACTQHYMATLYKRQQSNRHVK